MMEIKVCKRFTFEAAHYLPNYDGPCKNLHGHSFKLLVEVKGHINPETGMVIDFKELKKIVDESIISMLDHSDLNQLLSNPTAEYMVYYIWTVIRPTLPRGVTLSKVRLYETEGSYVEI